jgi:hypothetical protein
MVGFWVFKDRLIPIIMYSLKIRRILTGFTRISGLRTTQKHSLNICDDPWRFVCLRRLLVSQLHYIYYFNTDPNDQQYYKQTGERTLALRTFFKFVWAAGWGVKKQPATGCHDEKLQFSRPYDAICAEYTSCALFS